MKATPIIIAGIICGAAAGYVITSNQYVSELRELKRQHANRLADLNGEQRKALAAAKHEAGKTEAIETVVTETVTMEINPTEILQKLAAIEMDNQSRYPTSREIIFHLETLASLEEKALPALRDYLAGGEDVSYGYTYNRSRSPIVVRGADGKTSTNATVRVSSPTYTYHSSSYGSPTGGYIVPPSLRVGLFQVTADIGTPEATELLADALGMSMKGGEVAFLDTLLKKLQPDGKYQELALQVAKDLLLNPLPDNSPRDYSHETHLYSMLIRHRDLDFAQHAEQLLVKTDGRLNRNALNYLNTVLQSDAVPLLAKASQDDRLINAYERQSLITSVMRYTGQHPQADQMFLEIMRQPMALNENQKYYHSPQYTAINGLSYNSTQETATKRKALLESVRESITDTNLKRAADSALKRLEYRINPQSNPYKKQGSIQPYNGGTFPAGTVQILNERLFALPR